MVVQTYDLNESGVEEYSHAPWFWVALYKGSKAPLKLVGEHACGGTRDIELHSLVIEGKCVRVIESDANESKVISFEFQNGTLQPSERCSKQAVQCE